MLPSKVSLALIKYQLFLARQLYDNNCGKLGTRRSQEKLIKAVLQKSMKMLVELSRTLKNKQSLERSPLSKNQPVKVTSLRASSEMPTEEKIVSPEKICVESQAIPHSVKRSFSQSTKKRLKSLEDRQSATKEQRRRKEKSDIINDEQDDVDEELREPAA